MRSLYLRIWLTVVAALALFALVSGWMWQRHLAEERERAEQAATERLAAWAELVQRSLPPADAPAAEQAEALIEWASRLRVPMALDSAAGERLASSDAFRRRELVAGGTVPGTAFRLSDGRTLWVGRRLVFRRPSDGNWAGAGPGNGAGAGIGWPPAGAVAGPWPRLGGGHSPPPFGLGMAGGGPGLAPGGGDGVFAPLRGPAGLGGDGHGAGGHGGAAPLAPPWLWGLPGAVGPLVLVALLFVAVAAGAYPVVRRLTRRLEALKQGVAAFGAGDLGQRVDASGRDEVAEVAATFNRTAERIESLVQSHKRLLANASHELRSPLARLKMAVALLAEAPAPQRAGLQREIHTNIAELDALVEEVLLASRLDAGSVVERNDRVDLLGTAAEETARVGAELEVAGDAADCVLQGNERLLRRALRNLLENARRYGGDQVMLRVEPEPDGLRLRVSDRGPGVPAEYRERIFEPYFRLPGHAEREGGVGLGLALVRQIAKAHGGEVSCAPRAGGGTDFVLTLPLSRGGPVARPGSAEPA